MENEKKGFKMSEQKIVNELQSSNDRFNIVGCPSCHNKQVCFYGKHWRFDGGVNTGLWGDVIVYCPFCGKILPSLDIDKTLKQTKFAHFIKRMKVRISLMWLQFKDKEWV